MNSEYKWKCAAQNNIFKYKYLEFKKNLKKNTLRNIVSCDTISLNNILGIKINQNIHHKNCNESNIIH